jgi:hypothetical protein
MQTQGSSVWSCACQWTSPKPDEFSPYPRTLFLSIILIPSFLIFVGYLKALSISRSYSVKWWDEQWWMLHQKGFGEKLWRNLHTTPTLARGIEENRKNRQENRQCPNWGPNHKPPEYESRASLISQQA